MVAMFMISAGLVRTHAQLLLVLCISIAVLSAFIVNTATVTVFIPIGGALAWSRRIPASRVLIPLSFASHGAHVNRKRKEMQTTGRMEKTRRRRGPGLAHARIPGRRGAD